MTKYQHWLLINYFKNILPKSILIAMLHVTSNVLAFLKINTTLTVFKKTENILV